MVQWSVSERMSADWVLFVGYSANDSGYQDDEMLSSMRREREYAE